MGHFTVVKSAYLYSLVDNGDKAPNKSKVRPVIEAVTGF